MVVWGTEVGISLGRMGSVELFVIVESSAMEEEVRLSGENE